MVTGRQAANKASDLGATSGLAGTGGDSRSGGIRGNRGRSGGGGGGGGGASGGGGGGSARGRNNVASTNQRAGQSGSSAASNERQDGQTAGSVTSGGLALGTATAAARVPKSEVRVTLSVRGWYPRLFARSKCRASTECRRSCPHTQEGFLVDPAQTPPPLFLPSPRQSSLTTKTVPWQVDRDHRRGPHAPTPIMLPATTSSSSRGWAPCVEIECQVLAQPPRHFYWRSCPGTHASSLIYPALSIQFSPPQSGAPEPLSRAGSSSDCRLIPRWLSDADGAVLGRAGQPRRAESTMPLSASGGQAREPTRLSGPRSR